MRALTRDLIRVSSATRAATALPLQCTADGQHVPRLRPTRLQRRSSKAVQPVGSALWNRAEIRQYSLVRRKTSVTRRREARFRQ